MQDLQRSILNQVASGEISAEEGASRLEALERPAVAPVEAAPPPREPASAPAGRKVRIVSQFGAADVVGDPTVAFAVADGPHRARQEGDTMVIEHEPLVDESGSFLFGAGNWRGRRLTVRINPDLELYASLQAGNLRVEGMKGPITAEVQAGNCRISDFRGPLNLSVQAGNVTANGRLEHGSSRVRCEMGAIKIGLDRSSSVRVVARASLGKLAFYKGSEHASATSGRREMTFGSGEGTLDIDCTMGNVAVFQE